MKRMLFVVNVDWFFLSHRWPIAEAVMAQGTEVHLATGVTPRARSLLENAGVAVHEMPFSRRGQSPAELARLTWQLRKLHRFLQPDLSHHVTVKPVLVGSLASRLAGTDSVVNAISGFGHLLAETESGRVVQAATLQAYRVALRAPRRGRVVFQNEAALKGFVQRGIVGPADARLIRGMGVDPDAFYPPHEEPSPPIVMLVGRMIRSKGVAEFLAAATTIREAVPGVRCALVGPTDRGNPLSYTHRELKEVAERGVVEYWGTTDDVAKAMRRSTIQVFPTYHEGLPKTLLEAAATGRAIVATDIPGCREVIKDRHNGRLISPRDSAALASAVVDLLHDDAERARLGAAARQTILDHFTVDHAVRQHLELYEELLA